MNISKNSTKIIKLTFDDKIYISLSTGDILTIPYTYTKKIEDSPKEDLKNYHLIGGGIGVHFESIDEDISLNAILRYKISNELLAS
jgi:hypothetical protein